MSAGRWSSALVLLLACRPSVPVDDGTTSSASSAGSSTGSSMSADTSVGSADGPATSTSADGGSTSPATGEPTSTTENTTTGPAVCMPVCEDHADCNNGRDDDGDGLVDMDDPECINPCQNGEDDTFDGHFFGQDNCKVECYFDDNGGQGDDSCVHNTRCDPLAPNEPGCPALDPDSGSCLNQPTEQAPECLAACLPMTLPGCDCFGCCTFDTPGGPEDRWLGYYGCTLADPSTCPLCTPDPSCINECDDPCEWCFGQPEPPGECRQVTCEHGPPCSDQCDCAEGSACLLGCCRPLSVPA